MIELPKLQDSISIVEEDGKPSLAFHRWWQEIAKTLEGQLNTINSELETLIAAAQTTANTAAANAIATAREAARINSYPNPGSILTAADVGTTAKITVGNHTRVYPVQGSLDVPDVTMTNTPFDITGLAFSTQYWVYYDDSTLASTTPTFHVTTTAANAQVGAAVGRHLVGFITTPADGGANTDGFGGGTPGGGGGHNNEGYL